MSLFTDDAETVIEKLAPWAFLASLSFVAYALSRHVDWQDAVAITFVLRWPLVALGRYAARPL